MPQTKPRPDRSNKQESPKQQRKHQVLAKRTPSTGRSIANAIVIKDRDLFFLAEPDGCVPISSGHGCGLYYHDCRFLNGYEIWLGDSKPQMLVATDEQGFRAIFELTNADIKTAGKGAILKERIGIKWERMVCGTNLALYEVISFQNFSPEPIEFPVSFELRCGFEDVFAVRGLLEEIPGKRHPPAWRNNILHFRYDGKDGLHRELISIFIPAPHRMTTAAAHFHLRLQPQESQQIRIILAVSESSHPALAEVEVQPDLEQMAKDLHQAARESIAQHTEIRTDSLLLKNVIIRSLCDLHMLKSKLAGEQFFAAGLPWFASLFGRDSLITGLQTLAYEPGIAEQTLRLLAHYQGQRVDAWRDEQPGKILHEIRDGELAHLDAIPHSPYYGSIDATPLFLILLGRHAAWTGDLTLFNDLRSPIERALIWIAQFGDLNGDGYIEYQSNMHGGLINQGWKDSGDAIVNADGSLAAPPIALVEAQAYVYYAKCNIAELYRREGLDQRAQQLLQEAEQLRARFNRDFWLAEQEYYALALQADHKPAAVLASNPGHALWAGIADGDKASKMARKLMGDDMFSGWGVRTLSTRARRYNPIGYHLGTVWPHDNALIAAGLRRYGFDDAAARIFDGIIRAAMCFPGYRLPELFAGFSRQDYGVPVRYPVANHPQAWAAGAAPYLLETMLGLVPEAFEQRLRIVRPILPEFVHYLELIGLRVGGSNVDLRFERNGAGTEVKVLTVTGELDVQVQPGLASGR
ncbi:MAG TPA: glycogen debranching N-terminal domain-containing protein [Acidiferrobacterales bacterium]|nr:glycogen debranching N-terminal domain-containing protein [Acidiferrobacterales bacterium]